MDRAWNLDPDVAHLNHGSFGCVPNPVLEVQARAASRIERSPDTFYRDRLHEELASVRQSVGDFLGVSSEEIALVRNVTEAIATVLSAVTLGSTDSVVISDHTYWWARLAITQAVERAGASLRVVELPDPLVGDFSAEVVSRFLRAVDDHTRLVVVDQVTSASALLLPAGELVEALGGTVPVLVDAAHAPGMLDEPLVHGATFWVGSLHKWAFSARTAAVLRVASEWRDEVRPLLVSAGRDRPFAERFDYQGTQNVSSYLALPTALDFPAALGLTWQEIRTHNAGLLDSGCSIVETRLGATARADRGLAMRTLTLRREGDPASAADLESELRRRGVEVSVFGHTGRLQVRLSAQVYVTLEDFERFAVIICDLGVGRG